MKKEEQISKLISIYSFLKHIDCFDQKNLEFLWVESNKDNPEIKQLYEQIQRDILASNSYISKYLVDNKLIFELLQMSACQKDGVETFAQKAGEQVNELLNYHHEHQIDIPIEYLTIENSLIDLRFIKFTAITDADKNSDWWKSLQKFFPLSSINNIRCFATLNVVGDEHNSIIRAAERIQDYLNYLRGLLLPINDGYDFNFCVLGENIIQGSRPFRSRDLSSTKRNNYSFTQRLGQPIGQFSLQELIRLSNQPQFNKIIDLITSDHFSPSSIMKAKFLHGLKWLGEATKPDTLNSRYVKLAFALEAIYGTEPKNDTLATRGIKASIAERAAFIGGANYGDRFNIHSKISKFYDRRSGIVHGNIEDITIGEFLESFQLIRTVTFKMIDSINEYKTVEDFQKYILKQRYS